MFMECVFIFSSAFGRRVSVKAAAGDDSSATPSIPTPGDASAQQCGSGSDVVKWPAAQTRGGLLAARVQAAACAQNYRTSQVFFTFDTGSLPKVAGLQATAPSIKAAANMDNRIIERLVKESWLLFARSANLRS
jgi:hypothetical protein